MPGTSLVRRARSCHGKNVQMKCKISAPIAEMSHQDAGVDTREARMRHYR